ncbi:MAG: hypothetical protein ACREUE_20375 [Panacagrimonas sp.]
MRFLAVLLAIAVTPAIAQVKDSAVAVQESEAVVTVTKVDKEARTVTFRGPRGNLATLNVPKESQNLDRVKPGDRFKITYAEAVVVALTRGGQPHAAVEETMELAPKGAKPGGYKVRTFHASVVVDAIDYKNRYIALRGPKGNTLALPVSADVKDFDKVTVGDKVSIAYSQALALEMVPVEKPKKPATKKK